MYFLMVVAENEMIHMGGSIKGLGEFIQRLLLSSEDIFPIMRETAAARPSGSYAEGHPRMEGTEKLLEETAVEYRMNHPAARRNRTETVAMPEAESAAIYLDQRRLAELLHAQTFEITVGPYVVVAREEEDLHSPVHQRLQSCEDTEIAFRDDIPVFIPEIPDVSEHIECVSLLRKRIQERDETSFPGCRIIHIQPEMNVGNEICKFSRHAKMKMHAAATRQ